ncbi:MAG: efflux RND transporter permease subunit [Gammaproteobacteria bacterium]|nr:efflux RND transporter permease subunit [Gammaproteobacteria bacterium]
MFKTEKGIIAWFAGNPVAANLLMVIIIAFGIFSGLSIRKQTTPDFTLNNIQITVPYLGAAPQEVEEGVVIKIEEAIQNIQGINRITSNANEGFGRVTIEVNTDEDINEVLSDVKNRVDAISTFPALTEKPVIAKQLMQNQILFVNLTGDMDEKTRKTIAQQIKDELTSLPEVNQAQILGNRNYEVGIEISEHQLKEYGLTLNEVATAVKKSSVNMPGGAIKTDGGDILLRTKGQAYTGREFEQLVLRTNPDGTRLILGDIADIKDGFEETHGFGRFNGKTTATIRVLAIGDQNELTSAAAIKDYMKEKIPTLPDGIIMESWGDRSFYLQGRLDMMMTNMMQGALLVFLILTLFLRLKIALWVIIGIPICFLGALWLMPLGPYPVTINMISLFGFILVLGIVVDDAIIIGESVYTKIRADGHNLDNVIRGAKKVATAATFGVLTTIAAFTPMMFVGGIVGPFFESMSVVVILCLIFSLVESKWILPAHLAHTKLHPLPPEELYKPYREMPFFTRIVRFFQRIQRGFQNKLNYFIHNIYKPLLKKSINNRGIVVALFNGILIITAGLIMGGQVRFVMFPDVPSDFVQTQLTMEKGTAPSVRNKVLSILETAVLELNQELLASGIETEAPIKHVMVFTRGDTAGLIFLELTKAENRVILPDEITNKWRTKIGDIPGVKDIDFSSGMHMGGGPPISFQLYGENFESLEAAATELEKKLSEYDGVFDIRNTFSSGSQEIQLAIKPEAEALGLTQSDLGRQVRQAFYGEEAQRMQRGKDEIRVMVRYPREERRSIADLENMRIRTPAGDEVPFFSVADIKIGQGYSTIFRENRQRSITVSADADPLIVEPGVIMKEIKSEYLPEMLKQYSGVNYKLQGASLEEQKLIKNIVNASMIAMFLIFALIAIPLHSYTQPLVIMSVIPFGLVGAVLGHVIMGEAISMMSLFGLIALAGVVVNDSLIMVDFINKAREEGLNRVDAVIQSGTQRFRAILLTSLTTAFGLMPIMMEKSLQAQFVIPMAISMSFGIIFATVITLFLIPSLYLLLEDFTAWTGRVKRFLLGQEQETAKQ